MLLQMRTIFSKTLFLSLIIILYLFQVAKAQNDTLPSFLVQYCNYDKLLSDKPIERKYIDMDVDVITNKVNKLASLGNTISGIETILPKFIDGTECNCRSFTKDIGYKLKMTEHTFFGGSGTYTASALYFDNNVIQLRLTISFPYRNSFDERIANAIKLPFDCVNGAVAFEKTYIDKFQLYNKTITTLFLTSTDSNDRRKEAINYFTNVLAGWPPLKYYSSSSNFLTGAFDNLRYFITNNDFDALEQILFCPDLNSRVLAARTLIYLKDEKKYQFSELIKQRIDDVISKAEVITIYPNQSFIGEIGKLERYDLVNDFEKFLKNK